MVGEEKMSEIEIVPCTPDQVETLQRISRVTFEDTFSHCTAPDDMAKFLAEAYATETLLEQMANPESFFYFITVDGTAAGYLKLNIGAAQVEQMPDTDMELERLYILPTHKRQGLGSKLMDFALARARELGKTRIWLGVWEGNEAALALYKRNGFEIFGEHTFQVGDDPQIDLLMRRSL